MVINWSVLAVYNTIMSVATGIGLLLILRFGSHLAKEKVGQLEGWAIGFGIPGFVLTITGAHMIFTWPLSKVGFPFDDIIFGEPSLAFGVLLVAVSILLWRKSNLYLKQGINMNENRFNYFKERTSLFIKTIILFCCSNGTSTNFNSVCRYQIPIIRSTTSRTNFRSIC